MSNASPVSKWLLVPVVVCALDAGAEATPWQCESRWEAGFAQVEVAAGVTATAVGDVGAGPELFFNFGTSTSEGRVSRWDGTRIAYVGTLRPNAFVGEAYVHDLVTFDPGSGTELFIAGAFQEAGGVGSANVIRWNGTDFLPAAIGDAWDIGAYGLCIHDDGSGPTVYAGGDFASAPTVSRWNGSAFVGVGSGLVGSTRALASFDDGTGAKLYAAGSYGLARWDGSTWTVVTTAQGIDDMVVADLGAGPRLYVGGAFTTIEGSPYARVAAFDGSTWSALGAGIGGTVHALQPFMEGGVLELGAGGTFATAGGSAAPNCAKWDGIAWHAVGGGTNGTVGALELYDGGQGLELVAGGSFTTAGNVATSSLARWTSTRWAWTQTAMLSPVAPPDSFA